MEEGAGAIALFVVGSLQISACHSALRIQMGLQDWDPSIYLSICLSVCLSIYLSIYLYIYIYLHMSAHIYICVYI